MPPEVPDRMWLPLLILKSAGKPCSKTKFQNIAFLTQHESKIRAYDFEGHYGPHSDSLILDMSRHPSLVLQDARPSYRTGGDYNSYVLTDGGAEQLSRLVERQKPELVAEAVKRLDRFKVYSTCELLEESCAIFESAGKDRAILEKEISDELGRVTAPIRDCYDTLGNRQSTFILSTLTTVSQAVERARGLQDVVQRGIIFNIARQIIQKCRGLDGELTPPVDSESLRPVFLEIHELIYYLTQYCETRGIMRDPLSLPLEDVIAEDEAVRLSEELSRVKAPA